MNKTENAMRAFHKYIESLGDQVNEDNIQEYTQKFIQEYNQSILEKREGKQEYTDEEKAYNLFDEAMESPSEKQTKKLLKQALQLKPDFLDAKIELAILQPNIFKRIKELEKLESEEKERLVKEGYFLHDIGSFYGLLETRPYIRLLYSMASLYQQIGAYRKAMDIYETIITLNTNDNTGSRFSLMGIYTSLEEQEKIEELFNKYPEDNIPYHLFQSVFAFKICDYTRSRRHIRKVQSYVPTFRELINGTLKEEELDFDTPDGYYSPYSLEEILMYMNEFENLFTNDYFIDFIKKNT